MEFNNLLKISFYLETLLMMYYDRKSYKSFFLFYRKQGFGNNAQFLLAQNHNFSNLLWKVFVAIYITFIDIKI